MRSIDTIIIHCAATKPSMDVGKAEIDRWHRERGFFCIGYHYVIRRNGEIEKGRDNAEVGAHAKGYNAHSLGVCLVGGIDDKGKPECNFTKEQWDTLEKLLSTLRDSYGDCKIIGHNEVSDKACPCFDVQRWTENGKGVAVENKL